MVKWKHEGERSSANEAVPFAVSQSKRHGDTLFIPAWSGRRLARLVVCTSKRTVVFCRIKKQRLPRDAFAAPKDRNT